ncbi:MAG: hypothetical protein OHK0017_08660 [Patescibacteria group bacterium]
MPKNIKLDKNYQVVDQGDQGYSYSSQIGDSIGTLIAAYNNKQIDKNTLEKLISQAIQQNAQTQVNAMVNRILKPDITSVFTNRKYVL